MNAASSWPRESAVSLDLSKQVYILISKIQALQIHIIPCITIVYSIMTVNHKHTSNESGLHRVCKTIKVRISYLEIRIHYTKGHIAMQTILF